MKNFAIRLTLAGAMLSSVAHAISNHPSANSSASRS
jgi:hypothetical protein